jgi:hypothetical protein
VASYDPADAAKVCELVRSQAALSDTIDRLLTLYGEVIGEFRSARHEPAEAQRAAGRHLTRYAAMFKAFSGDYLRAQGRRDPAALTILEKVLIRAPAEPPPADSGIALSIDEVVREYGVMRVSGWLAHQPSKRGCAALLFMQDNKCIGVASQVLRPDVNEYLNIPDVHFGFHAQFNAADTAVRMLAVMDSGTVFEISSLAAPAVQRVLQGFGGEPAEG